MSTLYVILGQDFDQLLKELSFNSRSMISVVTMSLQSLPIIHWRIMISTQHREGYHGYRVSFINGTLEHKVNIF